MKKAAKPDVKDEFDSLARYRKALTAQDKAVFDKLLNHAKNHVSACAKSDRSLFESMLLAIVLEQQKKIDELSNRTGNPELETGHRTPHDFDLSILGSPDIKHPLPWVS